MSDQETGASVKLWQHAEALQIIDDWIVENEEAIAAGEGELPKELAELLDTADKAFNAKAANVGRYINSLGWTGDTIKTEEQRLGRRRKALENVATKMKAYLLAQMQAAGKTKIKEPFATLSVIGTERVESTLDEAGLRNLAQSQPTAVRIIPEKVELARTEAKALLKAGTALKGITIITDAYVRIT